MPGIILLNVQTERPLRQVVNRCVPCLPEVIGLNVPVVQLVGIQAELNSRLEIHGRVRDCQIPFRILRVPERLCGRFIHLGIFHALHQAGHSRGGFSALGVVLLQDGVTLNAAGMGRKDGKALIGFTRDCLPCLRYVLCGTTAESMRTKSNAPIKMQPRD